MRVSLEGVAMVIHHSRVWQQQHASGVCVLGYGRGRRSMPVQNPHVNGAVYMSLPLTQRLNPESITCFW
jgi:hypothetical protein